MFTISFFGHRRLWREKLRERLIQKLEPILRKNKEVRLLIGRHGDFDKLALSVCRELRKEHPNIKIVVIFTTLSILKKDTKLKWVDEYSDVETMIYNIEEEHYKNQIISSNKQMVDDSDLVICYCDMNKYGSGAKRTIKYALKRGVEVINLFEERDNTFLDYAQ